jgi:uncharacterized protein
MIVVSDTSPISALLIIEQAHLLAELFGEVVIPVAVHTELLRAHSDLPRWLRVEQVQSLPAVAAYLRRVDAGEAEAIQLAKELGANRLLIDDLRGRNLAEEEGLRAIGLIGVLLLAKSQRRISSVRALIERLRIDAHVYLADAIILTALQSAGEA